MRKLVEALKTFGLSEYEAKILLALIAKGELTVKELSEYSGVPRTSVYDVVKSLSEKGLVEVYGKPLRVRSLNSEDLMRIFSKKVEENLKYLREELPAIEKEKTEEVKVYRGEIALDRICEVIGKAKEVVVIATRIPEEVERALRSSGAYVKVCTSNPERFEFASELYSLKFKTERMHGLVIVDGSTVAIFFKNGNPIAVMGSGEEYVKLYKALADSILGSEIVKRLK